MLKKGEMMFKKGVSPLIATVLLVMIVVSIGAAVMVVIQGLTDEQFQNIETQQDAMQCGTDVAIKLVKADQKYRICMNVTDSEIGNITLLMENVGQKDINGFRVVVYGDVGFNSTNYGADTLTKGELKGFQFKFGGVGSSSSEVTKIAIQPQVEGKEKVTCQEPNLEFDKEMLTGLQDCGSVSWDARVTASSPSD